MEENDYAEYDEDDDFDESNLFTECPRCGRTYDEIDYEYQICHFCKFNANTLIL